LAESCNATRVSTCCAKHQSGCYADITTDFTIFFSFPSFIFRSRSSACHILYRRFLARLILRLWRRRRCYSETSVDFQRITRRYIRGDSTLHHYSGGILKSYDMDYCSGRPLLISEYRKTTTYIYPTS
jgi:hypothetical protein